MSNSDSPTQRGAGLPVSPGVPSTQRAPGGVPGTPARAGGGLGTLGADGAAGRVYSLEAVESLERRCDELQAQVASLQAAAVVRAGILEDQASRIHRTDVLLAEAYRQLETARSGGTQAVSRPEPASSTAARAVRAPARVARRLAGALAHRLRP